MDVPKNGPELLPMKVNTEKTRMQHFPVRSLSTTVLQAINVASYWADLLNQRRAPHSSEVSLYFSEGLCTCWPGSANLKVSVPGTMMDKPWRLWADRGQVFGLPWSHGTLPRTPKE